MLRLWLFLYYLIKIFISPADNMALLAEEVCGCKAELLSGGLSGENAATIITHLWGRQPVLIPYPPPKEKLWRFSLCLCCKRKVCYYRARFLHSMCRYDEDFNHEPCQRSGHRAHWAVASGKIGGVKKTDWDRDTIHHYKTLNHQNDLEVVILDKTVT